ncbi:MAG: hypothetical protein ACK5LV_07165 [Lachnospirales bacterium]
MSNKSIIIFGTETCPDVKKFLKDLDMENIEYTFLDILENMGNLKKFLKLRDTTDIYNDIRGTSTIGIPLLCINKKYILEPNLEDVKNNII